MNFRNEFLKIKWAKELEIFLKAFQGGNTDSNLKTKYADDIVLKHNQQQLNSNNSTQQKKPLPVKERKLNDDIIW